MTSLENTITRIVKDQTPIDLSFKNSLRRRLQIQYETTKSSAWSVLHRFAIAGFAIVVLFWISLTNAEWRQWVFSLFSELISPFYANTKTIVVDQFIHDDAIESWEQFVLSNSWSKDVILIANASSSNINRELYSWSNIISLTQTNINIQALDNLFHDEKFKKIMFTVLSDIIKQYSFDTKQVPFNRGTDLIVDMSVQEKNGIINAVISSSANIGGAHPEDNIVSFWFDNIHHIQLQPTDLLYSGKDSLADLWMDIQHQMLKRFPDIDKEMIVSGTYGLVENYDVLILSGGVVEVIIPKYQALPWYLWNQSFVISHDFLVPSMR